jgi:ribonuclease R
MKDKIYELISHGVSGFIEIQSLVSINKQKLGIILEDMIEENKIIYDKIDKGYYPLKTGKMIVKDQGFGFITVDGEDEDYYVYPEKLGNAYTGDEVLFYPYGRGRKLMNAKVVKVITRAHTHIIGTLVETRSKKGTKYYINSNDKNFNVKARVTNQLSFNAPIGSIVYADITYVGTAIEAAIKEVIGFKDDPGVEISQIALEYGFETKFPDEVLEEIKDIPDEVLEEELVGRRDYRELNVITIDGDDSKDFDDAVYLEKTSEGNFKLYVFIADVAHYVKEEAPLDVEALKRSTSVYLADRVIPMLPRKLSNGICSLNENVDRLVLACEMEIDLKGNLVGYEIVEGVIKSHHRMTYNNVNKIINKDDEIINQYTDLVDMIDLMVELSDIIRQRRYKKGGIEFEVDEYKFTLNSDGSPSSIVLRSRDTAEKLIEDFMLQANETVAYHMNIMNLPCVYRIHEKPDQEKLMNVFSLISNMGVNVKKTQNEIHPKQIQDALSQIEDSPYQPIINSLLLRSMMKAKYSEKCLGHYGLAMNYYCHFTSPIRRYPDLMTHRLIKNLLIKSNIDDISFYEQILPDIADLTSIQERKAVECERTVNDMLYAWYMEQYIHKEYKGIITSITSFGMFITLPNGVEGLLSFRNMDGYYTYNQETMTLVGNKKQYRMGDSIDIVVIFASRETRKIDFMLKEDYNRYKEEDFIENYMYK